MSSRIEVDEGLPECCPSHPLCPLSRMRAGEFARIRRLPDSPDLTNRLREMGFCEEQVIRLITCQASFICQVCNARMAISARLADSIMVERMVVGKAA